MTDFLNKIINIAKSAQSDRIISQAAKEKRDRLLPSFTTYQGIDPKDGTDKVMINGETNSGFNLISNASLSIGERVFLRPNQSGGLQRVDARNVAPVVSVPVAGDYIFFAESFSVSIQASVSWSGSAPGSGTLYSYFLSGASQVHASNIFSIIKADEFYLSPETAIRESIPFTTDTFEVTYSIFVDEPNEEEGDPSPDDARIFVTNNRSYNGSQWVDAPTITVSGFDTFDCTVTIIPTIYTFTYDLLFSDYIMADGSSIPIQSIDLYKQLGFKSYNTTIFVSDSSVASETNDVDWSLDSTYDLSTSPVSLAASSYTFSTLTLPPCYFTNSPIL